MRDGIEVRAPGTLGFPATELIHQHDSIPELGEVLEGQKIFVRHPRPAVKAEHGPFGGRSIDAIEEPEAENLHVALDRFHATRSREYAAAHGLFGPNQGPDFPDPAVIPGDFSEWLSPSNSTDPDTAQAFRRKSRQRKCTHLPLILETYYVATSPDAWDSGTIGPPWNPTRICNGGKTHARRIRTWRSGTPGAGAEPRGSRALPSMGVRRANERRDTHRGGGARVTEGGNEGSEPARGSRSNVRRGTAFDH